MRYQSPSIADGLKALNKAIVKEIIVLAPFSPNTPSSHQWLSNFDRVIRRLAREWQIHTQYSFYQQFCRSSLIPGLLGRTWQGNDGKERIRPAFTFLYHGLH